MPQLYLKEVEPFILAPKKDTLATNTGKRETGPQKVYSRHLTKRNTSLIATDALLLCLEILQVLAILQAMSLKWVWPKSWIYHGNFIFFFNVDIWEFIKVNSGGFISVQNYDVSSFSVKTKFEYILYGWACFFGFLGLILVIVKVIFYIRQPTYLIVYNARVERVLIFILQIIALPFGSSIFKVFHCSADGLMSVNNDVECWMGVHWAYLIPVILTALFIYVVFPIWLIWCVRREALAATSHHHEDFLKLKEVEYMSGLDVVWEVRSFYIFSSFRLRGIYYRPITHFIKLTILIIYAATFQSIMAQAICMAVLLTLLGLVALLVRPFRVTAFNIMLVLGIMCLAGDAIFGTVITQFSPIEVQSPWLVEPYSRWILVAINGVILLAGILFFILYLIIYRLCCQGRFILEPLWPVMTAYEYDVIGVETKKYMDAVLKGRAIIEQCRRLPSIFAPVHELSHQIWLLNAYMRESELMCDKLHPVIWTVLDEMIDMYHQLEPKSLFGEMIHESIRKNAANFITMIPVFAQRLAQRDYDFILVSPIKKRLLLKMYIIAVWMQGKNKHKNKQQLTQKLLTHLWEESPDLVQVKEEQEYHEALYPNALLGPDTEILYMTRSFELERELYDLDKIENEEESLSAFLRRAPPILAMRDEENGPGPLGPAHNPCCSTSEQTGQDNPAFTEEEESGSHHIATVADVHDKNCLSPAKPLDLEIVPKAEGINKLFVARAATLKLKDFEPGESSTDVKENN